MPFLLHRWHWQERPTWIIYWSDHISSCTYFEEDILEITSRVQKLMKRALAHENVLNRTLKKSVWEKGHFFLENNDSSVQYLDTKLAQIRAWLGSTAFWKSRKFTMLVTSIESDIWKTNYVPLRQESIVTVFQKTLQMTLLLNRKSSWKY